MNEEQIAIETLKEVASDDFDTLGDDISPKMAQNILNVIDKQQKEIARLSEKVANNICANVENEVLEEYRQTIDKQQKEIEEKTTIIMAGAEKVKQLEKEYINKDKIRERIKEAKKIRWHIPKLVIEYFEELLEEN